MGPHGHFDLAASEEALSELAAACRKRGIEQAMMDLRTLRPGPKPVFSPADRAELVGTFRKVGFTLRQRLAILYQSDPHRRARLFAFLSTLHGWDVRAFGDFEEALLWLSKHHEAAAGRLPPSRGKQVPVRFSNRTTQTAKRASPARRQPNNPRAERSRVLRRRAPHGSGACASTSLSASSRFALASPRVRLAKWRRELPPRSTCIRPLWPAQKPL